MIFIDIMEINTLNFPLKADSIEFMSNVQTAEPVRPFWLVVNTA